MSSDRKGKVIRHLKIDIVDSIDAAPGYGQDVVALNIEKCVIIRRGTVEGNPTVDIQFEDQDGKKYVALVTGNMLGTIAAAVSGCTPWKGSPAICVKPH